MNYDALSNPMSATFTLLEKMFGISKLSNEMQAKIIYLFIKTDGNCSEEELLRFDEICEHLKIDTQVKHNIIGFCECLHLKSNTDNSSIVISEIDKILKEKFNSNSDYSDKDKINQAFVIWTMLNLAYADYDYTEPERKVVVFLIERWNMNSVLISEMNDTLETVLALTNHIDWLKTTTYSYDYVKSLIEEYENIIKSLFNNIELSISEVNI